MALVIAVECALKYFSMIFKKNYNRKISCYNMSLS